MYSPHPCISKSYSGIITCHQHIPQSFETIFGSVRCNPLKHIDDYFDGSPAIQTGIRIGFGRNIRLGGMYQRIDRTTGIKLKRQPFEQLRYQHSIVGHNGIVGQSHFSMFGGNFSYGYIGHLASGSTGGRQNDQLFFFDDRNFTFESFRNVFHPFQYKQFGNIDHRSATDRNHPVQTDSFPFFQDSVHHFIRWFS